jgi:ABC-type multidrug transport system ATPase subunit
VRQDETFINISIINKAGVSVLIVEQNARRALQICDRGYVLDQGRDAYSGSGRELMNDPKVIELYLGTLAAGQEKATADAKAQSAAAPASSAPTLPGPVAE